ncbi:hypothetical protein [Mycolicibacterium komossense]|uniref:Uncharacterized protein n=1 Tax=Mycolicibacterium komossense TaxID=1779 RepID=A0ABT3C7D5_9MYCO|nr:hypothetical protein [Mycolicibacterium komossense]MCV7225364.1 hypothetical protein [Mycolicibacterium komossense]
MDERHRNRSAEAFKRLRSLGQMYLTSLTTARELSVEIEHEVKTAKAAGRSLAEISKAAGLSTAQIEYILMSVQVQQSLTDGAVPQRDNSVIRFPGGGHSTRPNQHRRNAVAKKGLAQ